MSRNSSQGSSPLSRGIPGCSGAWRAEGGIIPALAGNTVSSRVTLMLSSGSSPLSRGIRQRLPPQVLPLRIIPALAGNTPVRVWMRGAVRDHPRSRGEYRHGCDLDHSTSGSSPLSRGIRVTVWRNPDHIRIIPALAGNTTGTPARTSCASDHPRSRGEYEILMYWCS